MPISVAVIQRALKARAAGETWHTIAQAAGVTDHALMSACRRWMQARSRTTQTAGRGWWRPLPPERLVVARVALAEGQTYRATAERSGLSYGQVARLALGDKMKRAKTETSYWSSGDVAQLLDVQPRTLAGLVEDGERAGKPAPAVNVGRGRRLLRWRPSIEVIEAWLQEVETWRASSAAETGGRSGGVKTAPQKGKPSPAKGQKTRRARSSRRSATQADLRQAVER